MEGTIVNYRLGRHTQRTDYMVIKVEETPSREEAEKLIGKDVSWKTSSGKEIKGKITGAHGKNGAVKVKFEKGMPGQSIATKVKVV